MILVGLTLFHIFADFSGYKVTFIMLGVRPVHLNLGAFLGIGPQLLRLTSTIECDHTIGCIQDISS
ncbi:hypothetical protein D3C76_1341890 [compost metagenome]